MRPHLVPAILAVAASVLLAPVDVASAPPGSSPVRPALLRSRAPLSVGAPNAGRLVRGEKLDSADLVRVVPAWGGPDFRWGLPQLVGMLERAAAKVMDRHGGPKLNVGDLSRRTGGTLRKHKSHQSGRDADIAFYMTDERGKPMLHHRFVTFGPDGRSTSLPEARFDDARNWTLVEAMLSDKHARVQRIFVSDDLRRRLLGEAERRGVSRRLRLRAARVMMQPKKSSAHADHFHVRIACPKDQRGSCEPWPRRGMADQPDPEPRSGANRRKRGKRRR